MDELTDTDLSVTMPVFVHLSVAGAIIRDDAGEHRGRGGRGMKVNRSEVRHQGLDSFGSGRLWVVAT